MNEEFEIVSEPISEYISKSNLVYKEECFEIIGACMEVHRELGRGFLEVIYKDALEIELKLRNIPYEREKAFKVNYKGHSLERTYKADFIVFDKIILEAKAKKHVIEEHYDQSINYLAMTKCKLGLLVNFGEESLKFKRIVL